MKERKERKRRKGRKEREREREREREKGKKEKRKKGKKFCRNVAVIVNNGSYFQQNSEKDGAELSSDLLQVGWEKESSFFLFVCSFLPLGDWGRPHAGSCQERVLE